MHGIVYAQYEAANWYFGENAGIQFDSNTNKVSALIDGKLNTKEGASSISDEFGNLLFYTDGTTVYNRNHEVMDNGTELYGNSSSTQSAIVIPKPKSTTEFYIFTVGTGAERSVNHGFNYSIVDITENGGLGKIILKNQNLLPYSSEKLSAVIKDCNTQSIWMITLSTATAKDDNSILNTFYAYEITEKTINTTPVKSTITSKITDIRGALKLSPDGTKMANANMKGGLYLYDFDASTGAITQEQRLTISTTSSNNPYGVEFSPNNKFLYVHATNDYNGDDSNLATRHQSALIQYDLEAADISNSQVTLDNRKLFRGALQLGPDGKIYRALSETYEQGLPYLGVIENPNAKGTSASYKHNAIPLKGNNSTQGLPPFIQSFFNQKIDIIHANDGIKTSNLPLCTAEEYTLKAEEVPAATYLWTINGNTITNTGNAWEMEVSDAGLYKVLITPNHATICDIKEGVANVTYNEIPVANAVTYLDPICDLYNDETETVDLTTHNNQILRTQNPDDFQIIYFKNQSDADTKVNAILVPGSYRISSANQGIIARIENKSNSNCYDTTSFSLQLISSPNLQVTDITQCDVTSPFNDGLTHFNLEESIVFADADYLFYDTDPNSSRTPSAIVIPTSYSNTTPNQIIYVRATNDKTGCYTDQSFLIRSIDAQTTEETAYYCTGSDVILNSEIPLSDIGDYTFQWFLNDSAISGATHYEYLANSTNSYEVVITEKASACVQLKRFTINESGIAIIDADRTKTTYSGGYNNITVTANGLGIYEYALFKNEENHSNSTQYRGYQSESIFTDVYPGKYTVKVRDIKNNCGLAEQVVYVVGFTKFFTPNGDGYNDTFKIEGATNLFMENSKVYIFNRYGKLLIEIHPKNANWDGTFNGNVLPEDDYWFSATLSDGRTFTSHFTLKR
ncbi:T9SS type B sorting domain-containing protein [Formosa sp. PL04]|uniref:T9SS type B sorting domain-containing protein n=1 Tax=Formosa sp. PL04 TaxID=3081755 RepID=UPI0029823163|nr:T9SS type B sorting domain-containing protein [Formosa sp. PL04]MDW5288819.1 T9SS type B sorting domain-containing protein [Formosa sp. PL04]